MSKPIAAILKAISPEVTTFIITHHKKPDPAPKPNIPAVEPIKIFAMTRLYDSASKFN